MFSPNINIVEENNVEKNVRDFSRDTGLGKP
jgi:hypothetical protein